MSPIERSAGAGGTTGGGITVLFNEILTDETTASLVYTDLATVGPRVTITVGASGQLLCGWNAQLSNNILVGVALSGANTKAATDDIALYGGATAGQEFGRTYVFTGLSAGATVVTCKYRVTGGTQDALRRSLWAIAP